jgi:hypothetical protein
MEADTAAVQLALSHVRTVSLHALESSRQNPSASAQRLKRILRIYNAAITKATVKRELLSIHEEIFQWIKHQKKTDTGAGLNRFILLLAEEANPSDVLEALNLSAETEDTSFQQHSANVMRTLLRRAAASQVKNSELSGALMRIRHTRLERDVSECEKQVPVPGVWKRMSSGMATVLK